MGLKKKVFAKLRAKMGSDGSADDKESRIFLDSIVENLPNMIFIKDAKELRFVMFNKAGEELLGYSRKELIGKNDYDFFPKDEAAFFQAKDHEVLEGKKLVEIAEEPIHTRLKGLRILRTKKIPLLDALGRPKYLLGISEDITEHKKRDDALKESQFYNRTLFEDSAIGLALCRMDGQLVDLNLAYAKIIGRSVADTLKLTYWDVTPKKYEAQERKQLEDLRSTGRYGPYEKEYIHKDGHLVPVRLSGRMIVLSGQEFIWSSVEDITERARTRNELLSKTAALADSQAEKEQLEVFTYLASHDLQEPLQKIIGFSELLKSHSKKDLDAKGQDYLDRVQNTARRMTQMIHDLLSFSRITTLAGTLAPVDLGELVNDVLGDLEMKISRSQAKIEIASKLPTVMADRTYLRQLFQNLIANALKFRKKTEAPHIRVSCRRTEDGTIQVSVKDNGIGFDEKNLDRIFKPFERLHGWGEYEGSGMGLAICQKIVQRHKGQITAASKPGEGSTFSFTLPCEVSHGQ